MSDEYCFTMATVDGCDRMAYVKRKRAAAHCGAVYPLGSYAKIVGKICWPVTCRSESIDIFNIKPGILQGI